ncbi:p53-like transcription factor [Lophium mytilinum]|uniref:p53-like transcription factor n=1 Tax=Lophium mytilinum TaxID=390894 RepID=A0A6A6QCW1_9PEZI|nr:p53-like transcription factor [Lophium mytilinum]
MNQVIQPLSLASDYPLSSEQECSSIEHISSHAHHSFAVPDTLRRDGQQSSLHSISAGGGMRYMPHRPHEAQHQTGTGFSDSSSGSISTSPSSNASSLAFSSFSAASVGYPTPSLANSYSNTNQYFPNTYQQFGNLMPRRMSSITDHSTPGMLPPARSPGIGNPVSPSLGASARDNYTTSTPHLHRHSALSPRGHPDPLSRAPYGSLPETPRSLQTSLPLSPPSASSFSSAGTMMNYSTNPQALTDTPPFNQQENYGDITCDGQTIVPHIDAKIEKGFFFSNDRVWTCYRRNYFSVLVSYALNPHISNNGRLYLTRGSKPAEQIQSIAMSLSAAVDGATGKTIELIQHTPKRDKGPQLAITKQLLSPTPPGKSHNDHTYGLAHYQSTQSVGGPYLPLQNDGEQPHGYAPTGHSAATHQHTFERIQFKSATANNGKRRAQQQYYHLIVELWVNIQKGCDEKPNWFKVAQRVSQPVVVRGRSPSHYQNEGPHGTGNSGRGGTGPGGPGHSHYGAGGLQRYMPSGGLGGGGLSGGYNAGGYRPGNQYSLDPSPVGSHSVSSASSLSGGPVEGLVGDQHMMDEDESKAIDGYDGYQYYPSPIYDAGIPQDKPPPAPFQDTRRIKEESVSTGWQVGGCGRFQGIESSRGYYPDLHAAHTSHTTY